ADSDCIPCVYIGGDTDNVEESCEVATRKVVCDLVKKYEIVIEDVTALRNEMYDRCGQLYCFKKKELEHIEKGEPKVYVHEGVSVESENNRKKIVIDFLDVLRTILSDYCPSPAAAKQNLARKAVDYLINVFNLQIVDANYRETTCRFDVILCTLDRESYLRVKERVLGIKEELKPSAALVEQDCITSVVKEFQVPVSVSPVIPSNKRSLWSVVGEGLDASFKRIRFSED
uniref:Uncharacterized protein n=1 Tax=Chenopodium quinoa TaxID=63459 RepID=A0A803MTM9_CHEQI